MLHKNHDRSQFQQRESERETERERRREKEGLVLALVFTAEHLGSVSVNCVSLLVNLLNLYWWTEHSRQIKPGIHSSSNRGADSNERAHRQQSHHFFVFLFFCFFSAQLANTRPLRSHDAASLEWCVYVCVCMTFLRVKETNVFIRRNIRSRRLHVPIAG